jgi:hypothetical protein
MALTTKQVEWAKQQEWFRSAKNAAAHRNGEAWSVMVWDAEVNDEIYFDHYKSLFFWAVKIKA